MLPGELNNRCRQSLFSTKNTTDERLLYRLFNPHKKKMNFVEETNQIRAIQWIQEGLRILDQRKLPHQVSYEIATTAKQVAEAIQTMKVRGAPAIGITAAYGVALAARQQYASDPKNWKNKIDDDLKLLAAARPTAVNLFWAIRTMRELIGTIESDPAPPLLKYALRLHEDDIGANRKMGEAGADLLSETNGILTHCNTGSLATGGYGTALGVVRSAFKRGQKTIYASETRPWLQGARLTVWELQQDKIPATLIVDSAAASLMRAKKIGWVIVGADRIAANGDVANKIGTYSLAVLARHHGVKFMVVAPTSTIDWDTKSGDKIVIEQRDSRELLMDCYFSPDSVIDAWNPVFDVTPGELIDAIVTEKGIVLKPNFDRMNRLKRQESIEE